jgi:two-component system sensor histidine kinase QseC
MSRSLRFRLTRAVVGVLAAALVVLSIVLHAVFARALHDQLDGRLRGDAAAVAGMAEDDGGKGEFEYESLPEFERAWRPAYFQAWLDDGRVLARSPSLGAGDLARAPRPREGPRFFDLPLPDGRRGRAVELRQPLRFEDGPGGARPAGTSARWVTVVVARGTEEVAETLASVRRWLLLLGLGALCASSAAAVLAVSRGLRPTTSLARQIAGLDAAHLHRALPTDDLPREIEPVVAKMNELLARLRESFAREQRFTADVSHELRTPLAALRTTLEVAASRERTAPAYRGAIDEAGAIVRQMQALCENLLALARLDAGPVPVRREEVDLRALVDACWRPFAAEAAARRLTFTNQVDAGATAVSDAGQLRLVVSNLLSNAATYTDAGGAIRVRAGAPGDARPLLLEVHDSGPRIPDHVLPHVFERFFRGDATRSDSVHCGIGLALARGLSDAIGLSVEARNTDDGGVSFTLWPRDAGVGAADAGGGRAAGSRG